MADKNSTISDTHASLITVAMDIGAIAEMPDWLSGRMADFIDGAGSNIMEMTVQDLLEKKRVLNAMFKSRIDDLRGEHV